MDRSKHAAMGGLLRFAIWRFERGFLRQLRRTLEQALPGQAPALLKQIRDQSRSLYDANLHLVEDAAGASVIHSSALALASYRLIGAQLNDRRRAWEMIRDAVMAPGHKDAARFTRLALRLSRDPLRLIATIGEQKQPHVYGKGFLFETHTDNLQTYYFSHVRKCLYHTFFTANGAPELTPAFCAYDDTWGNLLREGAYGVRFDRPTTIAAGDDRCRFEFRRTTAVGRQPDQKQRIPRETSHMAVNETSDMS